MPGYFRFCYLTGHEGKWYRPGGIIRKRSLLRARALALLVRFEDATRLLFFLDERLKWMKLLVGPSFAVEVSPSGERVVVLSSNRGARERPAVCIYDEIGHILLEHRDQDRTLEPKEALFFPSENGAESLVVLTSGRALCFDATQGTLLWDTTLPPASPPSRSHVEVLAFLRSGYIIGSHVLSRG